mgnify:CR=1 FL=1
MKAGSTGTVLSTVFVDYDNIYLSLKRKSEEAARRFAKDAGLWLREIESGRLITPTHGAGIGAQRRIVMSRCYGNPVPRRNATDNSTDMNSFPFVRHHFLRAGFEVVDCPPLTAQLKNSADIRMVMDVRDMLTHETRFDEFILLSGDADFTPVLHRLRAHARGTVVFANDHTAQPYTAIADGEIREADLISLLLEGRIGVDGEARNGGELNAAPTSAELEAMRKTIVAEVAGAVRSAQQPVPLEALADRAVRVLGHEKTVGSGWGGAGTFRDLLMRWLPEGVRLTETPPYFAYEPTRHVAREIEARPEIRTEQRPVARERRTDAVDTRFEPIMEAQPPRRPEPRPSYAPESRPEPRFEPQPEPQPRALRADDRFEPRYAPPPPSRDLPARDAYPREMPERGIERRAEAQAAPAPRQPEPQASPFGASGFFAPPPERPQIGASAPAPRQPLAAEPRAPQQPATAAAGYGARPAAPQHASADQASQIQQSIARIHEACQAPPLSPPEYRVLFEVMAEEITANNLSGQQTLVNIGQRAREMGLEVRRDDIRFVLEVVSEADPWFEQGATANLFASRFRNFVVARCRSQGLNLSADEIDLIDAWFGGAPPSRATQHAQPQSQPQPQAQQHAPARPAQPQGYGAPPPPQGNDRWPVGPQDSRGLTNGPPEPEDEFPRIVRSRLRG